MCREAALKLETLKIEPVDLMVEVGREANLMGETQSAAPVIRLQSEEKCFAGT